MDPDISWEVSPGQYATLVQAKLISVTQRPIDVRPAEILIDDVRMEGGVDHAPQIYMCHSREVA